jgi:hypothetical protein
MIHMMAVLHWCTGSIGTRIRTARPDLDSGGQGTFHFFTASRSALDLTQPSVQLKLGVLSPGIKGSGREADHSLPCSAGFKNIWTPIPHSPIRLHDVMFRNHRGNSICVRLITTMVQVVSSLEVADGEGSEPRPVPKGQGDQLPLS